MVPSILVTGFEPFKNYDINSSWQGANAAKSQSNYSINIELFPVDYIRAADKLIVSLEKYQPEICLLCGLGDFPNLHLEKRARKPSELSHVEGKDLYSGYWPWEQTIEKLKSENNPIELSTDAGEYVCESTYWSALNFKANNGFPNLIAFLHVPVISENWKENRIGKAISTAIDSALNYAKEEGLK